MKIAVSSINPVKIEAVRAAFKKIFPEREIEILSAKVKSGVSDKPMSEEETLQGALNRAMEVFEKFHDADFSVGIEGGVHFYEERTDAFAWVVIQSKSGKIAKSKTSTFALPKKISNLLKDGYELGTADDMVFKQNNSKQKNGAVGLLTQNAVTRKELYNQAVVLALIPHVNRELY
ncbi:MAG: inosine/xanthosine triphosphatase [Bacteroidales bacterium]|nr:inosine/xanthosine triphosphatase [Bacteroidales bacterium]